MHFADAVLVHMTHITQDSWHVYSRLHDTTHQDESIFKWIPRVHGRFSWVLWS